MLFGDYWLESSGGFPSAALVNLLGDFGVNDAAARAALSRMVKRGLLLSTKSGRTTSYRTSRSSTDATNGRGSSGAASRAASVSSRSKSSATSSIEKASGARSSSSSHASGTATVARGRARKEYGATTDAITLIRSQSTKTRFPRCATRKNWAL